MALVECPACRKTLPPKGIPKHVSGCPRWNSVIGIPPSEFNWDAYCKRGPYADGLVEGTDYVRCMVCASEGRDSRFKRMMDHLKKVHGFEEAAYTTKYQGAAVRIAATSLRREATVRSRFGVENVFQANVVKQRSRETMFQKHGAAFALQTSGSRQKIARTNLSRYGSENVFSSETGKAKVRATNLLRYGTEFPNQSVEVMTRRIETNMLRYGSPVPQGFGLERKTSLEEYVDRLALEGVVYTGDRSYWVRCKASDGSPKNRNPDFVVYSPENLARVQAGVPPNEVRTNRVIELLGDWWHREEIVGLPREAYEESRKMEYVSIGISCLILWESEVKKKPEEVRERLDRFLSASFPRVVSTHRA